MTRSPNPQPPTPNPQSDRSRRPQSLDLLVRIPDLAQDLLGVLAALGRRGSDRRGRALEVDAMPAQVQRPEYRVLNGPRGREGLDLLILERLLDVEYRPGRHTRFVEPFLPVRHVAPDEPLLDLLGHLLAVPSPRLGGREAGIF